MRKVPIMLLWALGAPAGEAVADLLVVLNKSDHEAVLVDPASLATVARIPTGVGPHEAAVSPDGRTVFVSNYGMFGVFREGERRDQPGNTISVLDLERGAARDTFDLGEYTRPHGIWVSRDGRRLWVTCEGAQAVLELDAASGAIREAWQTGQEVSHMLVPTPDERKLYVANIRSGSVSVIDRQEGGVRTVPTGAGAEGIDVTPDGREVWVTNRAANTVSVIATASDSVVASFESGGQMPIRVKFTPDGKEAWVSNARSNAVAVFDVRSRRRLATIEVGAMPIGIQMSPDGRRAFVANTNDDKVTRIDVRSRKAERGFSPGNEPDGMAWVARPPGRREAR
jgi:YVTN family beta-propeller protein